MIQNSNQSCVPVRRLESEQRVLNLFYFSYIYFVVFVYGAAPAEARYEISGVRKASVPAPRSFIEPDKLLENIC